MLAALQLITLLQGIFLLSVLFMKRKTYKQPALWLLFGTILAILFFVIGDDENNLFTQEIDWFFFDASLFITFLFLFVRYYVSGRTSFLTADILFFVPNMLYFANEVYEAMFGATEILAIEIMELCIELTFLVYLILTIRTLFLSRKQRWMLFFVIPLSLLMSASMLNEVLGWFELPEIVLFNDANFNTLTLVTVAILFYFITMKLIVAPTQVLLKNETEKYQSSGLNKNLIETYKQRIVDYMEEEQGFTDSKLSLTLLSQRLEIPKQYISEILNVHLRTNFQDFINKYRIDAFVDCLKSNRYDHYALMGIASEVGFNSKSSFYASFKKHKGLTPTEYKKKMLLVE
ncbi:MAG: AraC family transcriptional regulator [Bacteroidia bacterium]|nr:AraC family transcriptional regulator [Bacteroidia bacterium]NNM22513.1 helix-turn-helix transcriptional regulator [Flavobacteriaceae bacterium]